MNAPSRLAEPQSVRFTIDEFLKLDESGVLERYAKTELIDGEIIVLNAQYSEHFTVKTRLLRRLADGCDALGRGVETWSEGTIAIPPDNLPEPDLFVTRCTPVTGLVAVENVLLTIEVASTTLSQDLGRKAQLYASAGIPEYWVVDINARVIHQLWAPAGDAYEKRRQMAFGERIVAATVDGLAIVTTAL